MENFPEFNLWEDEGLFARTRYGGKDYSKYIKKKFLSMLRARFECPADNHDSVGASSDGGLRVPAIQVQTDVRLRVKNKFGAIHDNKMRDIMMGMALAPRIESAWDAANNNGYRWPQFVIDFNYGLHTMIKDGWHV